MLDIMEERKTSVLRVLTDISEAKSLSNGDSLRSFKETLDSPPSVEDPRRSQPTKKLLQKKNQLHPLFANHPYRCASLYVPRASSSCPKPKDVSQRIVSAKLLQIKELRNQLTLTQHQLNEVTSENRFLKTLQKRQEVALRKYEGHEARLPQLIQNHNEEMRILTSKLKQMKMTNQRLVEKLKTAEQQLSSLQQQHSHLVGLSRDMQLGEREALANQVQQLQHSLREQSNTVQLLTRKVDLERKNYKHELGVEKNKRNEVEKKLALAMQTIENLKDQIEAKEKCMNAIVPSRYVRGPIQTSVHSSGLAHSQMPRTPHNQSTVSPYKNVVAETSRRSSTDEETDIADSQNGKTTSDSTRTLNGTTLPKITPQADRRNKYKLSSRRLERSSTNETPDYSSSFTSVDISLKDLRKSSASESEKSTQAKRLVLKSQRNSVSSRGRKLSVDSGVMNKSDSGKATQRTDQSRISSSVKTRRNSIATCPSDQINGEGLETYLQGDSVAAKEQVHKSIREELRELEEKLLLGSNFVEKTRNQESVNLEQKDINKELNKGLKHLGNDTPRNASGNESDQSTRENLDDITWSEIHNRIRAESDAAEAKLEEYYNTLEKSELNLEDTENYIALEEEQKERLLNALKEIDKEANTIESSASSPEDTQPSSSRRPARRKSENYEYNFSKNIENLHRGRPVYDQVKVPVIEKMRKEEKEYVSDMENGKKNKADFMKQLFEDFDNTNTQTDSFHHSKTRPNKDRLVQLNKSFE